MKLVPAIVAALIAGVSSYAAVQTSIARLEERIESVRVEISRLDRDNDRVHGQLQHDIDEVDAKFNRVHPPR